MSVETVQAEVRQLTLPQLVEYSLQNNGELKSFRDEKGIREAGKVKAGLLPNPTLEFEGSTGALTGSSAESSVSLGISQEFLLAGKRDKRLASADRELEIYRWQLTDRERSVRDDVKTAYFTALLTDQRVALAERSIAINRQLLDVARERLAAGDIPELEANLVKVELARSEGSRIGAIRENKQSHTKLMVLLGAALFEQFAISGDLAVTQKLQKTLGELKQLARTNRPDLKILEAEKAKGDADIVLAQTESIPNLTAGLAVSRGTSGMEIGGLEGRDTAYTIGLKLSIPIPVFDRNQAGVQEARAKKNGIESRLAAAVTNIEREVETAYAGFDNSESVLSLYRDTILTQLYENLKLTQEAYRLGEVGILSIIQEQKKFFEVSDGYLTALHDRQQALIKLESTVATELTGGVR
jgi:cobalt-zinc-cadmium efflux system outer membrane protein